MRLSRKCQRGLSVRHITKRREACTLKPKCPSLNLTAPECSCVTSDEWLNNHCALVSLSVKWGCLSTYLLGALWGLNESTCINNSQQFKFHGIAWYYYSWNYFWQYQYYINWNVSILRHVSNFFILRQVSGFQYETHYVIQAFELGENDLPV